MRVNVVKNLIPLRLTIYQFCRLLNCHQESYNVRVMKRIAVCKASPLRRLPYVKDGVLVVAFRGYKCGFGISWGYLASKRLQQELLAVL